MSLINIGTNPRDNTGDSLRSAMGKINDKFIEVDATLASLTVPENTENYRNPVTIFVATDGDDENNGHSFAEPFATLEQAIEEAWAIHEAESNVRVLIKVAPGNYTLSNLPYRVPAFTSIMGDSLRSVMLFPAVGEERNGFFKVDDGFYMWGLTFRGHQADTAKTGWIVQLDDEADNTARGASGLGAYITASPYFQNCSSITAEDDSGFAPSLSTGDTGGGIYVNGYACAPNSPVRSIVLDSFTQINLDGIGCLVENDAYAQLVSFFGTFCRYHVLCRTGGQVNFTGGTTDFGTYGLVADGYSPEPVYTAVAQRDHYGVARTQQSFTVTAGNLLTKAGHGLVNDALLSVKSATSKPIQPTLNPGERYYVVNATTDTIQVAATAGGTPLVLSTGTAYTDIIDIVNQGELEVDLVNFSTPRYGAASVPGAGMLAFPVLTFPRTGSLAAGATTLGTVSNVEQDGSVYTAVAILDTAPASVGKHEYTRLSGSVTVTRAGAFVTPSGFTIETTPIAGLNTYTFTVTDIDYDHLTGITKFKATDYLPNALDEFYFTDCEFICPLSALVVLGSEPINQFGQGVPEGSPTAVGRQINVYNTINGGLQYPITQGQKLQFRRRSQISAPAHVFEYVGSGTNYSALPENGGIPKQANAYQELNNGKVFLSWTNEKGDFGVSNRFLVDGTTGEVTINATSFNLSGLNAIGPFSRNGGFTTVGIALREVSNNSSMNSSLGFPGDDTVPTQEAIVGYTTNILSGETQFEAIFINGVVIFAVGSSAEYPVTRPNGQALQAGDILWDATAQDWVRYDGANWNSEIKAIVRSDGAGGYDINYDFRVASAPTIRPDGLAIQNGDRWENPGEFVAYYSPDGWVGSTKQALIQVNAVTSSAFVAIYTPTVGVQTIGVSATGLYYAITNNNTVVTSSNFGATWDVLSTVAGSYQFSNTSGLIITSAGTLLAMDGSGANARWLRSTDNGVTWVNVNPQQQPYIARMVIYNGTIYAAVAVSTELWVSTDDGVTWTTRTAMNTCNAFACNASGTFMAHFGDVMYVSTNLGVSWTATNSPTLGNTVLLFTDGDDFLLHSNSVPHLLWRSSDSGLNWTIIATNIGNFASSKGTFVDSRGSITTYTPASVLQSPSVVTQYSSFLESVLGNVVLTDLSNEYVLQDGQPANHNGSNYFEVSVDITNLDDDVVTTYIFSLDDPFPSATKSTLSIPIDERSFSGFSLKFNYVKAIGSPSPIRLLSSLRTKQVYT